MTSSRRNSRIFEEAFVDGEPIFQMVLNPVGFVFVVFVPRKPEKVQGLQEHEPCLGPLIAKTAIRGQKEKHTYVGTALWGQSISQIPYSERYSVLYGYKQCKESLIGVRYTDKNDWFCWARRA